MDISLKIFAPQYEEQVSNLILDIQQNEFGVKITKEEQPDLSNISAFYQKNGGNFWIALDGAKVVGTIALVDIGNNQGALRKMFVHQNYRGKEFGIASRLLNLLIDWANAQEISEIYLGTTSKFLAAHRFYEKNGFSEISRSSLPEAFPLVAVDSKFYMTSLSNY